MAKIDRYDLSGGQNSNTSPLFMKDNECELVSNYNMDNLGSLTKRRGMNARVAGTLTRSILNMYFWKDTLSTKTNVLAASNDVGQVNSDIFDIESNAWTISLADDNLDAIPKFTSFVNYVFRTNGVQAMTSSTDPPTAWSTVNCLLTLKPKYCCVWEDRIYALNDASTTKYPSRIYWSTLPGVVNDLNGAIAIGDTTITLTSATGFDTVGGTAWIKDEMPVQYTSIAGAVLQGVTGVTRAYADATGVYQYNGNTGALAVGWEPTVNYADINPDDSDDITWGEPFGKMLLIFKNHGLYRWTFGQVEPDKIMDVGTQQGLTVKQTAGICFWANKNGVYAFTGAGQPTLISKKIGNLVAVDFATNIDSMRAGVDDDHYCLSIKSITVDGVTYTNALLVYTISLKTWHIETYPAAITAMAEFQKASLGSISTDDAIFIGTQGGDIYKLYHPTSTFDYNVTTATAINGKIITKEYPLANFPKTSILDNAYFLASKPNGMAVSYRIDRGEWKSLTDLKERLTSVKLSGRASTIQFSITDNSKQKSRLEGFSVELKEEKTTRR